MTETQPTSLLDPKNDFVFKKLFATAPALLTDLINAIRSEEEPVEVVEVLNPNIEPEELAGKFIVLDILAKDRNGHYFNIEMQVRKQLDWHARSTYYLAKMLTEQLKSGEPYSGLKPVIGIHLLDFDLFDDQNQAFWCFELRDRHQPDVMLGNELQFNIIELRKADRLQTLSTPLANWVDYFEHWQEENVMNQIAYPPVQQALEKLKSLSGDDTARRMAFVRERALRDEISQISAAKQEGLMEGELRVLIRLLERKFGPINGTLKQQLTQADAETLLLWGERILDASTLDEVLLPLSKKS